MHLDPWTLALQAINAAVLIWLLSRVLFRPVMAIIARRRDAAEALLAGAEAARAKASAEAEDLTRQRAALDHEAAERRAAGDQEAAAERAALLADARTEIERQRADAEAALARERTHMREAIGADAATLAVDLARRLLTRLPTGEIARAFAGTFAADLAALPDAERDLLASDASHLVLVSAAALDPAAQGEIGAAIGAAVAGALGVSPNIEFTIDPALLGGLELRGAHTVVRSSWRADLDRIAARLAEPAHAA